MELSKLSDVAKNDVVKKALYDKSAEKVNTIDTSDFVFKYQTDKTELEKKIPDLTSTLLLHSLILYLLVLLMQD